MSNECDEHRGVVMPGCGQCAQEEVENLGKLVHASYAALAVLGEETKGK